MKNIVKVDPTYPLPYKFIEWMITDTCNLDCVFCLDENKLGVRGRFEYDEAVKIIDKISLICGGEPYWLCLTGGEPTLHPKFIEIASYAKEKGALILLMTNGTRTLNYWEKVKNAKVIDKLFITWHPEQKVNFEHVANVANMFHDEHTLVVLQATYTLDYVDKVLEGLDYFYENTGSVLVILAMNIPGQLYHELVDPEKFERIKAYTGTLGKLYASKKYPTIPKQLWHDTPNIKAIYEDGSYDEYEAMYAMKIGVNKFWGWSCDIGKASLKIEPGIIYRGGCKVGSRPFSIDNIEFWDDTVTCIRTFCGCATDMQVSKYKDK